jgi:hypothetical protein
MRAKMKVELKRIIAENIALYIQGLCAFAAISVVGGGVMTGMSMLRDYLSTTLQPMSEYISDFKLLFGIFFGIGFLYSSYLIFKNIRWFLRVRNYDHNKDNNKK